MTASWDGNFAHGDGYRQLMRLQVAASAQAMPYMLAVGPPMSSTVPLNCGCFVIRSNSATIDSGERELICFP